MQVPSGPLHYASREIVECEMLLNTLAAIAAAGATFRSLLAARLYSTFLKPCAGGVSGKTRGNRGPVAQAPLSVLSLPSRLQPRKQSSG
jgi:hypothetical protein